MNVFCNVNVLQYASQEKHKAFEWFLPYDGGLRDHLVVFLGSMPSCDRCDLRIFVL